MIHFIPKFFIHCFLFSSFIWSLLVNENGHKEESKVNPQPLNEQDREKENGNKREEEEQDKKGIVFILIYCPKQEEFLPKKPKRGGGGKIHSLSLQGEEKEEESRTKMHQYLHCFSRRVNEKERSMIWPLFFFTHKILSFLLFFFLYSLAHSFERASSSFQFFQCIPVLFFSSPSASLLP